MKKEFPCNQKKITTNQHDLSGWRESVSPLRKAFRCTVGVGVAMLCLSSNALAEIGTPLSLLTIDDIATQSPNTTAVLGAGTVSADTSGRMVGILVDDEENSGTFINKGAIHLDYSAASDSSLYLTGLEVSNFSEFARQLPQSSITLDNRANISVSATSDESSVFAAGISAYGDITNSGDISVTATGGNDARAKGIYTYGDIINSGGITVSSTGGDDARATGISAYGDITNSGTITVSSTGVDDADATGISAYGDITNSGDITVSSVGGYYSPRATGIFAYGDVTNSGTITVTASSSGESGSARAVGIEMQDGGTVHSSGLIHVSEGAQSYQIFGYQILDGFSQQNAAINVMGMDFPSVLTTVTGFAMEFGSQDQLDSIYEASIGGNVEFSDDATLYAYTNNQIQSGRNVYYIPTLIEDDHPGQAYFDPSKLVMASPDYIGVLSPKVTGDTIMPEDQLNFLAFSMEPSESQTLTIEYAPKTSAPLMATGVSGLMADQGMNIVNKSLTSSMLSYMQKSDPTLAQYEGIQLASTDTITDTSDMVLGVPVDKKSSVFLMPYYTSSSDSSDPMGYDADIYGLTGGYNYHYNPDLIFGFHAGYGYADVDYDGVGYDQRNEEINSGMVGVQGIHRFNQDWLLSGTSTFFYTSNDYTDTLSTNRETGDYNTYGLKTNVDLGYVFMTAAGRVVPEIGLTHLWQHNQEFTTNNLDNADTTYGSMNENELFARLAVSWFGEFESGDWRILPNAKVGVEQAVTDGDLSNTMSVGSAVRDVTYEMDDTRLTLDAGLDFNKGSYSFGVGYNGSYSSDVADNSMYLQMKYYF